VAGEVSFDCVFDVVDDERRVEVNSERSRVHEWKQEA
jgi:hypothetical protein